MLSPIENLKTHVLFYKIGNSTFKNVKFQNTFIWHFMQYLVFSFMA